MTTVPTASSTQRVPRLLVGWIIGQRTDLLFFIGAAIGGYLFFFLHWLSLSNGEAAWKIDMVMVYFLWLSLIDAPHFFDTFSRTYLDRQEMKQRRRLLLGSVLILGIGPFVLLVCYLMFRAGVGNFYAPYGVLGAFVGIWAYWHVVRQHYGILSLYKRKNKDTAKADRWIDNTLLYVGTLAPFVALTFRHPMARDELARLATAGLGLAGWLTADAVRWFERLSQTVFVASVAVTAVAVGVFLARQLMKWQRHESINLPKLLFFLAVIPLHAFVLYHPAVLRAQLFMVAAFVTIFHDFQYHAIVWHYQRNRCHGPNSNPDDYGLAGKVSKNPFVFFGCAILMGVVGGYIGCKLDIVPGCIPMFQTSRTALFGDVYMYHVFESIMLGFLMHHYFVDQFIWRPSRDQRLRKDLRLGH